MRKQGRHLGDRKEGQDSLLQRWCLNEAQTELKDMDGSCPPLDPWWRGGPVSLSWAEQRQVSLASGLGGRGPRARSGRWACRHQAKEDAVGKRAADSRPEDAERGEQQGLDPSLGVDMCHLDPTVREDLSPQLPATSGFVPASESCLTEEHPPQAARVNGWLCAGKEVLLF